MKWTVSDYTFMNRALQLAVRGLYSSPPNPRVGCVLVKNDRVIAEGWHVKTGEAHAEIHALKSAGDEARNSVCYVSLEPCSHAGKTPPCTDALIAAGVQRVVIATTDPNPAVAGNGQLQLKENGIKTEIGLLADQAQQLNKGFFSRMKNNRPYIRCKLAMSLDGRTAMADGSSQWITSPAARQDVQKLRASSSAILTGIGTVLADDPELDVRDVDTGGRQPLRVVLDRKLRISREAEIFRREGEVIIYTVSPCPDRETAYKNAGLNIERIDGSGEKDFLRNVFHQLAQKYECNEVLVECGPTLAGSLLQACLLDELIIYMAPVLLGHEARALMLIPGLEKMQDRIQLKIRDIRMVGNDCRITLTPEYRKK